MLEGYEALEFFKSRIENQDDDCILKGFYHLLLYRKGDSYFHAWYLCSRDKNDNFVKYHVSEIDCFIENCSWAKDFDLLTNENCTGSFSKSKQTITINDKVYNLKVTLDSHDYHPDANIDLYQREYSIRNLAIMKLICPVLQDHLGFKDDVIYDISENDIDQYIQDYFYYLS